MKSLLKLFIILSFLTFFCFSQPVSAQIITIFDTPTPAASQAATVTPVLASPTPCIARTASGQSSPCIQVDQGPNGLNFRIPNLSDILTFAIRGFFVLGGLVALFYLLLGAFSWIVSGGEKEKVGAAQAKIQAAVVGVIMIVVVLTIVVTLEQVIFGGKLCLGLSCPITLPSLLKSSSAPVSPATNGALQNIVENTPTASPSAAISPIVTVTDVPVSSSPNETSHPYQKNGSKVSPTLPVHTLPDSGIQK